MNHDSRRFAHHKLDAYEVAKQALVAGNAIIRRLPKGNAALADQLRRAQLSALLNIAEAASRSGADRAAPLRCARGEKSEAAAALDAAWALGLVSQDDAAHVITLLGRLYAMLTRLASMR